MGASVGAFRGRRTQQDFLRAFETAMVAWPSREDGTIETAAGTTAVSLVRSGGSGPPLVLVPGGHSSIAPWAPFVEAWYPDRPVIAIDTVWDPGRSVQRQPVPDGAAAAAWLEEVLAGLAIDRAHLVGYSYGAWAALNYAVSAPSRLISVTAIEPPGTLARIPAPAWWQLVRMLLGGEQQYRSYLAWVRGGRLPESAMLDLLLAARAGFVPRGTPRPRQLTRSQWNDLSSPLMVLLAGRSRLVPARRAAAAVHRMAPRAELHTAPSASHAVLVDEPQWVIDRVRDFATRNEQGRDD